jgi:hypothetical protein
MRRLRGIIIWSFVSALGAASFAWLALSRGEPVSAAWLLIAALCTYAVSYRFYSKFIASKVFALDPARPTPAVRLNDGRDFTPTNRWIVFGHHFAAIAGPGPLVGPTLAAQFGFLPGALWIIIGVALGGAVQDFVILCASVRRDGKSLGQMAKEEIGPIAGYTALVAVLGIMIVLIAVLALVVVNALKSSPWGVVTIGLTIPTALIMGVYLRWIRPHAVLEASAIGLALLFVALLAGRWVAANPALAPTFTLTGKTLALLIMAYSFFASVLPVWLLLAPRDYLSAFVKIGVVLALALGIVIVLRWHRTGLRREDFPVRLHHDRVRRDQRLSFAHCLWNNTQAAGKRGRCANRRLRRDAYRVAGCGHGAHRRLRVDARRVLRNQCSGERDRHYRRQRGRGGAALGIHARSRPDAGPGSGRRGEIATLAYRRRAESRGRDGAHLLAGAWRLNGDGALVSLRDHVRSALHPHYG